MLRNSFDERSLTGVLIGSPLCEVEERLQIDALLITPTVVCIIDFKNFRGKVNLPAESNFEIGLWTTEDGDQIKGGSSINPFVQLKKQKRRLVEVANRHIQHRLDNKDLFNPNHVVRAVCFQDEIELNGNIPANESLNFFIFDKADFVEGILDIVDVSDSDVRLSAHSFDIFKEIFRASEFKVDDRPLEAQLREVVEMSAKLNYDSLRNDQKLALTEIKGFLEDQNSQIFILWGTTNSGKSHLVPFIQELAYSAGIQDTEIFAATSRVARNLVSSVGLQNVNSVYSFIFGGRKTKTEEEADIQQDLSSDDEQDVTDELILENVPLKQCDNSDNALFIVDESHLVSDSYHQSIDLVFGSGHLLRDFLAFTDVGSTKRKIVFVGDPYQLQLGKIDESPLNPAYLENQYQLRVVSTQLLDNDEYSDISKQALSCVQGIRSHLYNSLRLVSGGQLAFLNGEDVLSHVSNLVANNMGGHILTFSNEESQKVNSWVKRSVVMTGEEIAPKDLVLFNNNISVEDEKGSICRTKKGL